MERCSIRRFNPAKEHRHWHPAGLVPRKRDIGWHATHPRIHPLPFSYRGGLSQTTQRVTSSGIDIAFSNDDWGTTALGQTSWEDTVRHLTDGSRRGWEFGVEKVCGVEIGVVSISHDLPVPTKKSVDIEIIAFTESRPVAFPSHVESALFSARLFPHSRRPVSRDSCSPTSVLGLAAFEPSSQASPRLGWPSPVGLALTFVEWLAIGITHRKAGDRYRLAPQGFSPLLDMEESALRRPPNSASRSDFDTLIWPRSILWFGPTL